MKKCLIIILLLMFLCLNGWLKAEKVGTLENLHLPQMLEISHNQVYCIQETTVHMYDLKNLKFIKKFCKKGEGPGELKINPGVTNFIVPFKDSIMVVSWDKAIVYSKDGILKEEFRLPPMSANYLYPLRENTYLGLKFDTSADRGKPKLIAGIMDKNMKIKKEIYKQDFTGGQNMVNLTADGVNMAVANGKVYIEESAKGFIVSIYDLDGKLLKKIQKKIPPVKFTKALRENALNQIKQNPAMKSIGWENFKKIVKFTHDEYAPLIKDLQVDQDRIYLMSTNFKEDKQEFVVMDEEGKILKKVYLPQPIPTDFVNVIFGRPTRYYKIYHGKYYYLKENLDEETWELHAENI